MKDLLKLGLAAFMALFLVGCGSSSSSGGGGGGDSDFIADWFSDIPSLDTTGDILFYDGKLVSYYDNTSSELAKNFNATIGGDGDFAYNDGDYISEDNFWHIYLLNDPASKGLDSVAIYIEAWQQSSYIETGLSANRSIAASEFAEIFGSVDKNLITNITTDTLYEGNLSVKFAEYYARRKTF
ncbi:MAG: hypothetical protein LBP54_00955 [Campylobacteraceae bacterium]|jgi:hypothetical protein|nr:hypothetical protein [Campylobacteraceae bacterium]